MRIEGRTTVGDRERVVRLFGLFGEIITSSGFAFYRLFIITHGGNELV